MQTAATAVAGRQVTTIEGLSADRSHPVQQAWIENDVPQCGYCQSGQIMDGRCAAREDAACRPTRTSTRAMRGQHLPVLDLCRHPACHSTSGGDSISCRGGMSVAVVNRRDSSRLAAAAGGLVLGFVLPTAARLRPRRGRRPGGTERLHPHRARRRRHAVHPQGGDGAGHGDVALDAAGRRAGVRLGARPDRVSRRRAGLRQPGRRTGAQHSRYRGIPFALRAPRRARCWSTAAAAAVGRRRVRQCATAEQVSSINTAHGRAAHLRRARRRGRRRAACRRIPRLKAAAAFRLIGKPLKRLDTPAKVDGSALFGIDVRVPGMRVRGCRALSGVRRYAHGGRRCHESARTRRREAGRSDFDRRGRRGRQHVERDGGPQALADSHGTKARDGARCRALSIRALLRAAVRHGRAPRHAARATRRRRWPRRPSASKRCTRRPYLAHAAMEPLNCVATSRRMRARSGRRRRCRVQRATSPRGPSGWRRKREGPHPAARRRVRPARQRGLHRRSGRGGQASGVPVKVTWSREDDTGTTAIVRRPT